MDEWHVEHDIVAIGHPLEVGRIVIEHHAVQGDRLRVSLDPEGECAILSVADAAWIVATLGAWVLAQRVREVSP